MKINDNIHLLPIDVHHVTIAASLLLTLGLLLYLILNYGTIECEFEILSGNSAGIFNFRYAVIFSIGVGYSLMFELLNDISTFERKKEESNINFYFRGYLVMSFLIYNILMLIFSFWGNPTAILWYLIHFQLIAPLAMVLGFISFYYKKVWKFKRTLFISSLYFISILCRMLDGNVLSFQSYYGIISITFFFTGTLFVGYLTYKSIKDYKFEAIISFERSCSIIFMCTLLVVGMICGCVIIAYSHTITYKISFEYLAAHSFLGTFVIHFLAMKLGRKETLAIARSQVSRITLLLLLLLLLLIYYFNHYSI